MKLKYIIAVTAAFAVLAAAMLVAMPNGKGLVVHEWGTFTSLQGGDGELVPWKPLKTSELPSFVYNWSKPELGLFPTSMMLLSGKGSLVSLQRLETPVIYFYSDQKQKVDVSVGFPKGFITEWYPRAGQIGPSRAISNSFAVGSESRESLIRWSDLLILPAAQNRDVETTLPRNNSGSHYFAARETDADYLMTPVYKNLPQAQYEKFLFYRGVGDFTTPLHVTMKSDDKVEVQCNAWTTMSHLFVLTVKDKRGHFAYIDNLGPGQTKTVAINAPASFLSPDVLSKQISEAMSDALVKEGLFPREAKAMVATWKDSWFAEDGTRVLYVLPRSWTDSVLPMTLKPKPRELVRVMVRRAEILRPGLEKSLALALDQAKHGDLAARDQFRQTLKSLGRFAEPALIRAFAGSKYLQESNGQYWAMLNEPRTAN